MGLATWLVAEHLKDVMNEPKPNALMSLHGSGDVAADREKKRKNTAKSMIAPGVRLQEIYTPQSVLDVVLKVWPEGIRLDPCSGPDSLVQAVEELDGSSPEKDGLKVPWPSFTFVNPPYKDLKSWLLKAGYEGRHSAHETLTGEFAFTQNEIIVLCPVRTHRTWFRKAMQECGEICWMNPLAFYGYGQAFPAPLCLLYWGARNEAFRKATASLGGCFGL